jgi:hypothetical protein
MIFVCITYIFSHPIFFFLHNEVYEFSFWAFGGCQGYNWESWKKGGGWYNFLITKVPELANAGITHVWLPPPSQSHSDGTPLPNSSVYVYIISIDLCWVSF